MTSVVLFLVAAVSMVMVYNGVLGISTLIRLPIEDRERARMKKFMTVDEIREWLPNT